MARVCRVYVAALVRCEIRGPSHKQHHTLAGRLVKPGGGVVCGGVGLRKVLTAVAMDKRLYAPLLWIAV